MNENTLFARHALLPEGWRRDVRLRWDNEGNLLEVSSAARPQAHEAVAGYVLPGMVNLHSHTFQRAMGGLTEIAGDGQDSFWTWRDLMYRFARHITPQHVEAIAAQLFAECLRHGYTALCEFHYVQRDANGAFYARPAEMAERVIAAANATGMGLTMLPVLYSYAGFGEKPLSDGQKRFKTGVDDVLKIVTALEPLRNGQTEVGVAPHSLRAATTGQIGELLAALPAQRPVHIHIAEQRKEIDDCVAWSGQRPVQWLYRQLPVDARWCLVHATHLLPDEVRLIAGSGAIAGLCPTTEANLGDGIFPLVDFMQQGGRFGIGSDSHISQSAVEELRWLEYGQRLQHQQRNIAVSASQRHVGDYLWSAALAGGAQACGRQVGALAAGKRADLIVLDDEHPNLYGQALADVLNAFIFCGNDNLVRDVLVGGQWVVRARQHVAQDAIASRYKTALAELRQLSGSA